jgi:hypothetical protein
VADSRAPGLRVQIVLALAGLMILANVPLFFAVASLTRATLLGERTEAARALGRAVAAHVGDARAAGDPSALGRVLSSHVGEQGALALVVFDARGEVEASAGDANELRLMHAPPRPYGESAASVRGTNGRALAARSRATTRSWSRACARTTSRIAPRRSSAWSRST